MGARRYPHLYAVKLPVSRTLESPLNGSACTRHSDAVLRKLVSRAPRIDSNHNLRRRYTASNALSTRSTTNASLAVVRVMHRCTLLKSTLCVGTHVSSNYENWFKYPARNRSTLA